MRRTYQWSSRFLLILIVTFVLGLAISAGFAPDSVIHAFGIVFGVFGLCMSPFIALIALFSGIGTLIERNTGQSSKSKNEYLADIENHPERLQRILRQLSPDDRAYLQQQLAARRLGVSGDGELVTLDDLLSNDDDDGEQRSFYTG